jgi:hypothetical protein
LHRLQERGVRLFELLHQRIHVAMRGRPCDPETDGLPVLQEIGDGGTLHALLRRA